MPEESFELRRGLSNRKSSYRKSTVAFYNFLSDKLNCLRFLCQINLYNSNWCLIIRHPYHFATITLSLRFHTLNCKTSVVEYF